MGLSIFCTNNNTKVNLNKNDQSITTNETPVNYNNAQNTNKI